MYSKMVVKKFLAPYNFLLDIKEDGKEGLAAIKENKYDIILLDINIPEINGYQIAREIRKKNTFVPLIAVTASELTEVKEKVIASGMNDILIKPFSREALMKKINKYLK